MVMIRLYYYLPDLHGVALSVDLLLLLAVVLLHGHAHVLLHARSIFRNPSSFLSCHHHLFCFLYFFLLLLTLRLSSHLGLAHSVYSTRGRQVMNMNTNTKVRIRMKISKSSIIK